MFDDLKECKKEIPMIYCVEDDSGIRNIMIYTLKASGFEAAGFNDGKELSAALLSEIPELILLDIMLPGEDGSSILKRLRSDPKTADVPIIMATAKSTEYDKVTGLDSGADDYLSKPFGMMEMVSRVKAVLRRAGNKKNENTITAGNISVDTERYTASICGKPLQLTLKEFELLRLLASNSERVFTRDQLLSFVWGADFSGETRTVDVHIGTLREKLGDSKDYIETVRGVGYKLKIPHRNSQ